jgi:hypothetical protein
LARGCPLWAPRGSPAGASNYAWNLVGCSLSRSKSDLKLLQSMFGGSSGGGLKRRFPCSAGNGEWDIDDSFDDNVGNIRRYTTDSPDRELERFRLFKPLARK